MPARQRRCRPAAILAVAGFALTAGACADSVTEGTTPTTSGAGSTAPTAPPPSGSTSGPTGGTTVQVDVYLVDQESFNEGVAPYVKAVRRDVDAADPMRGALEALFRGPTVEEANEGLLFVSSGAAGIRDLAVEDGIARVTLEGGCNSGGSTLTIAAEIVPTLRQFGEVTAVKIYDPEGTTEEPDGPGDSIPECLEP